MIDNDLLKDLKQDINKAHHIAFLTGAGVSTHSGIPDYRSKNGIYQGVSQSPEQLLSDETLYHQPEAFYQFVMKNMYFPKAQPNSIHQKIAQLCNEKGDLITQNVDGLDKKAGNKHVIEFHGDLYDIYCTTCGQKFSYDEYAKHMRHEKDNGIIRPGIVLYGEPIDQKRLYASVAAVQSSDVIIISGTSFVVYPFAQLLAYRQQNAKVWILNNTPLAQQPDEVKAIIADARDVFSQL